MVPDVLFFQNHPLLVITLQTFKVAAKVLVYVQLRSEKALAASFDDG